MCVSEFDFERLAERIFIETYLVVLMIPRKPDGRKCSVTELLNNTIAASMKLVVDLHRMKLTWFVLFDALRIISGHHTDGHNVKSKYQVEELVIEGDIVLRCSLSSEHKGWWNLAELRTRSVI